MLSSQRLVTVIVSVYNIEKLLPKCLESISAQTYQKLEILLIDDGSTDESGRICDSFAASEPRARVIHQKNRGLYAVRNRGIEEAQGEYVVFPDGDDFFHKDYIRLLYEAINYEGKQYPLAICDYRSLRIDLGDPWSDEEPVFEEIGQSVLLENITHYPSCGTALWGANWNKLYRKSALPQPFQKPYRRCQDFDSNLRFFSLVDRAVYVHKVLYCWVQWSGQSTRTRDHIQIRNECRTLIFLDHFLSFPRQLRDYRPYLLINLYRRMIIWKENARGTDEIKMVSNRIRKIERKTSFSFLVCKKKPFRRRLRWLISLDMPSLLHLLGGRITMEMA